MEYSQVEISLTTVQGYLSTIAFSLGGMVPIFIMYGHPKIASGCGLASMLLGAIKGPVGQKQQDAGKQEAFVPGVEGTVMVPSHETPNDPNAKPVA